MHTSPVTLLNKYESTGLRSTQILKDFRLDVSTADRRDLRPLQVVETFIHKIYSAEDNASTTYISSSDLLKRKTKWANKDYRDAYAEAAVEQGVAWQIKVNREHRNWSQRELADRVNSRQPSISRMEDPEYGCHSLSKLQDLASAFDCALLVRFIPFSALARESERLSESDLVVLSYAEEVGEE